MSDDVDFCRRAIWAISSLLRRIPRPHIPGRLRNIFLKRRRRKSPQSMPESEQEHVAYENTYIRRWVPPPRNRQRRAPSTRSLSTRSSTPSPSPSPTPNQITDQDVPPEALSGSNETRKRKREWQATLYQKGLLDASDLSEDSLDNGQSSSSSTPNGVQAVDNEAPGSVVLEQAIQLVVLRNSCGSDYENAPLESSAGGDAESYRGEDDDEVPPLKKFRGGVTRDVV
ncbi:hypothetical protein F4803DRAFT_545791 [Xylaria telfairii]|nr:hypothetical protein F4803DRAFT_545791 [Xylaria telfairii]